MQSRSLSSLMHHAGMFLSLDPRVQVYVCFTSVNIPSLTCKALGVPCMGTSHCWVPSMYLVL